MAKNKTPIIKDVESKPIKKRHNLGRTLFNIAETTMLLVIIIAIVAIWYKPELLGKITPQTEIKTITEVKYSVPESVNISIENLAKQIELLSNDNKHFLNIKADSSVVLGMIERIDNIEKRVQKLSLLSNDGALILTAVTMIKESVANGQNFEYEAQLLKHISSGQSEIASEIDYIFSHKNSRFSSNKVMIIEFNQIADSIVAKAKPTKQTDWKERIKNKLGEYVKVNHPDQEQQDAYNEIASLNEIKALVNNEEISLALQKLDNPENQELKINFAKWYDSADAKLKFYAAASKISFYCLSLMHAGNLQNAQ